MSRTTLILLARALTCADALQTYVAVAAMYGIWSGLSEIHRPTALVVVSTLVLSGIVYARTRKVA